jgi:hypothetical protein
MAALTRIEVASSILAQPTIQAGCIWGLCMSLECRQPMRCLEGASDTAISSNITTVCIQRYCRLFRHVIVFPRTIQDCKFEFRQILHPGNGELPSFFFLFRKYHRRFGYGRQLELLRTFLVPTLPLQTLNQDKANR